MVREHKEKKEEQEETKYIEREVTLSLLNEKLNYIIGVLENSKSQKEDEDEE